MEGNIVSTRLAVWWAVLTLMVMLVGCDVKPFSDFIDNNEAPNPRAEAIVTDEDTPGSIRVDPNDSDTDNHDFEVIILPLNGTAEVDEFGLVTYTPSPDFNGSDSLVVEVTEAGEDNPEKGEVEIAVTVHPVNDPPSPTAEAIVTDEDTEGMTQVSPNDPDTDNHTFSVAQQPENVIADVDPEEGLVTYTPDLNYSGSDALVVAVMDDSEDRLQETVEIMVTVAPVNDDAPEPTAEPIFTSKNHTGTTLVEPNDPDEGQTPGVRTHLLKSHLIGV
ncbi:Ig-like domain-containing protein [Candidatus Entotheonella palauensis]|uniref:Ig-like domain-containing protein n=1 Tax=Candidatus Entotheonella palauensis TaxID=93172 RepID=UPI000B7D03C3|nr:Ig-like domain-containing protein [Candidatus Entotheonella palauensis]